MIKVLVSDLTTILVQVTALLHRPAHFLLHNILLVFGFQPYNYFEVTATHHQAYKAKMFA